MDLASHLSLVLDLSPVQWARAADDTAAGGSPLPLRFFLSQLLAFVNCHLAGKDENTLAVFGAFPGKRCVQEASTSWDACSSRDSVVLYSSANPPTHGAPAPDADSYQPFKVVDAAIMARIVDEVESLPQLENEGTRLPTFLTFMYLPAANRTCCSRQRAHEGIMLLARPSHAPEL
jgi:transcription initiation factor TFIIH subunit 3